MNCPRCGAPLPQGAQYCPNCQTPVQQAYGGQQGGCSPQGSAGNYNGGYSQGGYGANPGGYSASYPGYRSGSGQKNRYPGEKGGLPIAAKIILCVGAAFSLIMICGWFLTAFQARFPELMPLDLYEEGMSDPTFQAYFLPYVSITREGFSGSLNGLVEWMGGISSLVESSVPSYMLSELNTFKASVAILRTMKWIALASCILGAVLMIIPVFLRKSWAKFLGLGGLLPAAVGLWFFLQIFVGVQQASGELESMGMSMSMGIGGYLFLICTIVIIVCSIVPLFFKAKN